jgi:hypothetical protein
MIHSIRCNLDPLHFCKGNWANRDSLELGHQGDPDTIPGNQDFGL